MVQKGGNLAGSGIDDEKESKNVGLCHK